MSSFSAPRIMGIINCTPDSFFSGSRCLDVEAAAAAAAKMTNSGADILDIGGESTRPGSLPVGADEQISRIVPVIRSLREWTDVPVSVDTRNAEVAEAALDAGADIVNDISALTGDARMASLAAERDVPVVLMHMKGEPETMQNAPSYRDCVTEVRDELSRAVERALAAGISESRLILDPGIGFGKRLEDNTTLLRRLDELRIGAIPLLVGLSRKSFLGMILGDSGMSSDSADDRLTATLAAHAWCLQAGADILRVHDVAETRQLVAVWRALACAS